MEAREMGNAKVYDTVYCSSDWHSSPTELRQSVAHFVQRARDGKVEAGENKKVLVLGVGDLFDLMKHGWKAFRGCQAIEDFQNELGDLDFVYVAGNHDPLPWIGEIMAPLGNQVEMVPYKELEVDGNKYYFAHGQQWDRNARWFRLLTPTFIWLTSWAPVRGIVEWWQERLQPTPYALKRRRGSLRTATDTEKELYNQAVGWVHGGAGRHAETRDCVVVCGHTHKPWMGQAFDMGQPELRLHDAGDLVDSLTYLVIDSTGATLHTL